ncbi:hypothetical protein Tco_1312569 [Tanacetum coccineum]
MTEVSSGKRKGVVIKDLMEGDVLAGDTNFGIDCNKMKEKLSQDSAYVEEVVEHVTNPVMYEDVWYEDVVEQLGFSEVVEGLGDPIENEVVRERELVYHVAAGSEEKN